MSAEVNIAGYRYRSASVIFHGTMGSRHIKFWSIPTLGKLLEEAGFANTRFRRIGRISPLAKPIIVAIAHKP